MVSEDNLEPPGSYRSGTIVESLTHVIGNVGTISLSWIGKSNPRLRLPNLGLRPNLVLRLLLLPVEVQWFPP